MIRSLSLFLLAIALPLPALAGEDNPGQYDDPPAPVADELPDYIRKVGDYGERAELSHDAKRLLYVTRAGGEVEEMDLKTGEITVISDFERPEGVGFYRALYLPNGDYFLTGGLSRRECEIYILPADREGPPHYIPEPCWEGPAISRKNFRVAWTPNHHHIYIADIVYEDGVPRLENREFVVSTSHSLPHVPDYADRRKTYIEPQNLVPTEENVLTFSHYAGNPFTARTMTIDMTTGEITLQTSREGQKGEPEGVLPDGKHTLVESGYGKDPGDHDGSEIQMIRLDGSGEMTRLTHFSKLGKFKATNPVVSDDGRWMAFQHGVPGDTVAGAGYGLYLMDLPAAFGALGIDY